jgi:hypothetical protein
LPLPIAPVIAMSALIQDPQVRLFIPGLWGLWLFGTRAIWVPALVRWSLRHSWSRLLVLPFWADEQEAAERWYRGMTWAFLAMGAVLSAIAFLQVMDS